MAPLPSRLKIASLALFATICLTACGAQRTPDAKQDMTMKPSITYLHLLRHTPFFTTLSTDQLRWVIDHSREWETEAGSVIAKDDQTGASATDYWILLDGEWRLHYDGNTFPSGHAAPGKWFNLREAQGARFALITTEHSYVMRITEADMDTMLKQGFAFDQHLDDGRTYYHSIFHTPSKTPGLAAR
ncbi:hypothetical protein [Pseudomonas sp. dw_612]|uniref:hypothetical protein n=1 Tax=Pseudomonas sp. dw_612 TaxID=2720080 RepID=UPI00211613D3|nr:hypothetical protein [Pseudomonas sp. dw_612]